MLTSKIPAAAGDADDVIAGALYRAFGVGTATALLFFWLTAEELVLVTSLTTNGNVDDDLEDGWRWLLQSVVVIVVFAPAGDDVALVTDVVADIGLLLETGVALGVVAAVV